MPWNKSLLALTICLALAVIILPAMFEETSNYA